jgi:hypothetical protein
LFFVNEKSAMAKIAAKAIPREMAACEVLEELLKHPRIISNPSVLRNGTGHLEKCVIFLFFVKTNYCSLTTYDPKHHYPDMRIEPAVASTSVDFFISSCKKVSIIYHS